MLHVNMASLFILFDHDHSGLPIMARMVGLSG